MDRGSTYADYHGRENIGCFFARYGLPKELVSDNGPQFVSASVCNSMEFVTPRLHLTTQPLMVLAERVVQMFKHSLRTGMNDLGSLQVKLSRFLLSYRTTPHTTSGKDPAEYSFTGLFALTWMSYGPQLKVRLPSSSSARN